MLQQEIEKKSHSLGHTADCSIKRCPQCYSIFISHKECEGCGLQFDYRPLGEPLDKKSFYTIKESYYVDRKRAFFFFKRKKLARRFVRTTWHRFSLLVTHFPSAENEQFVFYKMELRSVIEELLKLTDDMELIKKKCLELPNALLKEDFFENIPFLQREEKKKAFLFSRGGLLLKMRLLLKLSFLFSLMLVGIMGLLVWTS